MQPGNPYDKEHYKLSRRSSKRDAESKLSQGLQGASDASSSKPGVDESEDYLEDLARQAPVLRQRAAYSREGAQKRYAQLKRHSSSGRSSPFDAESRAQFLHFLRRCRKPACILLSLALVAFFVWGAFWYARLSANMAPSEDVSKETVFCGFGQPYYVLLLGSDSRAQKSERSRADSIMLVRVDQQNKKVAMISMPRDLKIELANVGTSKLNAALSYNGFSGMISSASDLSGIGISYYAVVYFKGFKKLVNALGGVRVNVPKGTYYHGTWVPSGKNVKINGKQALVLARCRHGMPPDTGAYAAGDYQRTKNQRNLMRAIVKKILSKPIWEIPSLLDSLSECVETNMPVYKFSWLALTMRGMRVKKDMYSAVMPATSQMIGGVSYEILDESSWAAMKKRFEEGQDPAG